MDDQNNNITNIDDPNDGNELNTNIEDTPENEFMQGFPKDFEPKEETKEVNTSSDGSESTDSPRNEPPPPLTIQDKAKVFLIVHWRGIICFVTPLIFILVLIPFPPEKYQYCAYTLLVMAVFWVSECIPLPVTSFLPMVVFPLSGVMNTVNTCKCYMNDTIIMFLGSMILACAVEQSGLHNRLALGAIRLIGYSHFRLLFTMSFVTMFVSMWITNTAATTMMVPINFAILKVFEDHGLLKVYEKTADGEKVASDITACYFCSATFSATIGGIGTLVGTITNLVFKGLFVSRFSEAPDYLSFPLFSAFSVPYMLLMETCSYFYMCVVYLGFLRPNSAAAKTARLTPKAKEAVRKKVEEDWKKLGKVKFWEIMVIILFSLAIAMFFCRAPQIFSGWGDKIRDHFSIDDKKYVLDSATAIFVGSLMFLLPNNLGLFKNFTAKYHEELPKTTIAPVLNWKKLNDSIPYSFMFLLGGGFALSEAAKAHYTDFNGKIGGILNSLKDLPNSIILLILVAFTIFITNFASNVAVCNVITPIGMQLAFEIGQNPLWYTLATGYSASYCFVLAVGTPGNLIAQSAASIPTNKIMVAGAGPTVSTLILTWVALLIYAPLVWPDLKIGKPDWAKAN